jgi:queuine tRNA-ribosyltransferase subunit QTRTD1
MQAATPHSPPADMLRFIIDHGEARLGPRLGQLAVRGRSPISTPSYVASTSRGAVPHITQDILAKHTSIPAVYVGLEDCKLYPLSFLQIGGCEA